MMSESTVKMYACTCTGSGCGVVGAWREGEGEVGEGGGCWHL